MELNRIINFPSLNLLLTFLELYNSVEVYQYETRILHLLIGFAQAFSEERLGGNQSTATIFEGTSKTLRNELVDSILHVCKDQIRDEVKNPII